MDFKVYVIYFYQPANKLWSIETNILAIFYKLLSLFTEKWMEN